MDQGLVKFTRINMSSDCQMKRKIYEVIFQSPQENSAHKAHSGGKIKSATIHIQFGLKNNNALGLL